jgi:hypothetical protein
VETIKETSERVRPERVNKWPNSMLVTWWWWRWWWLYSEREFYVEMIIKYSYFWSSCQLCSTIFVSIAIKPDDLHGLLPVHLKKWHKCESQILLHLKSDLKYNTANFTCSSEQINVMRYRNIICKWIFNTKGTVVPHYIFRPMSKMLPVPEAQKKCS